MFSEKEKNAYKEIKAPVSLREKIVTSEKTETKVKPFFSRNIATLAACLIIAICIIPQMDIIKKGNESGVAEEKTVTVKKEREIVDASFAEPIREEKEISAKVSPSVPEEIKTENEPVMARSLPEPGEMPIEENPTVTEKISFPVNLNCGENSKISVSEGTLYLYLPEAGTKISGSEISATGDTWLVWEIETPDKTKIYEMKMLTEETEKKYELKYDSSWHLQQITE